MRLYHKYVNVPKKDMSGQIVNTLDGAGVHLKDLRTTKPGGKLKMIGWLVDLILNVLVNNFSVMLGRSHRFLGITSTFER